MGDHNSQPPDDQPEQIILDGNQLAEGHAFFSIGATDITDDGLWLAYTTDTTGFRQYTLRIKDLATGETLPGEVERVGSVVWAADNLTLFYTVEDEEQKRQYQLWRHARGTPHAKDVLVYQDDDERFNLGAGRTRDGKFLVLESASHTTSESRVLPASDPEAAFTLIAPRQDEHEYSIDHRNGLWFIRTNDRGRNFRLVTISLDDHAKVDNALRVLRENHVSATNYILSSTDRDKFAEALDRQWPGPVPYTIVIAPGGKILYRKTGAIDPLEVKRAIVGYLGRTY